MSSNYEYILSLQDRVSGTMQRITGVSSEAMHKFTQLNDKTKALQRTTGDFGGSINTLRGKIDLLQSERDIIDPKNLTTIRQYNSEIKRLGKELNRLETINGSALKNWSKDLVSQIPPIFKNPLALGAAAIGFAGKSAMGFDESMAKVNITAQLDKQGEAQLRTQLKAIASRNGADLAVVPVGFEKIISQVGEVAPSLDILDAALRGSKAGFTDTDTVAGALAQTLSIVGTKNASAAEVLDTFFAAKRVGAGEFKDFANYMPGLVASADALGIKYKEVAGLFAYMTGKGQSPEKAAVLMNNMFSMLGRGDVREKLKGQGISIFDNGKMRSTLDIFTDLKTKLDSFGSNDEAKNQLFENVGIVDKEARSAFIVMASDTEKLRGAMEATSNAAGETSKALEFSTNAAQRSTELWNKFKNTGLEIGEKMLPMIGGGLSLLNILLDGGVGILNAVGSATSFWAEALEDGNPLIWAMTTAVGAGTAMWAAHTIQLKAVSLWQTLTKVGTKSLTWSMGVLKGVMTALKTAWLTTPWGIAIAGIAAIGGAVYGLMSKTSKATETFASFNAELRRNKMETAEVFDAAKNATAGSQERARAIQAINDKYGEYLPNLLTEKSSNDEIAMAMSSVNVQIENKIRLKAREKEDEELLQPLMKAEQNVFKSLTDRMPNKSPEKQAELAAATNVYMDAMRRGEMNSQQVQESLVRRFNLDSNGVVTKVNAFGQTYLDHTTDIVAGIFNIWQHAMNKYADGKMINDARYGEVQNVYANPLVQPSNSLPADTYSTAAPAWSARPQQQPLFPPMPAPAAPLTASAPAPVKQTTNIQPKITTVAPKEYGGGSHSGSAGTQSQVIKLDTLPAADLAGSGAYKAIADKLTPRKLATRPPEPNAQRLVAATVPPPVILPPPENILLPMESTPKHVASTSDVRDGNLKTAEFNQTPAQQGVGAAGYDAIMSKIMPRRLTSMLAGAASLAMPVMATLPESATVPDIGASAAIETSAPDSATEPPRRTVSMTRFCDQLTINITHADGKGYDQIKDEVMAAITEAINIG